MNRMFDKALAETVTCINTQYRDRDVKMLEDHALKVAALYRHATSQVFETAVYAIMDEPRCSPCPTLRSDEIKEMEKDMVCAIQQLQLCRAENARRKRIREKFLVRFENISKRRASTDIGRSYGAIFHADPKKWLRNAELQRATVIYACKLTASSAAAPWKKRALPVAVTLENDSYTARILWYYTIRASIESYRALKSIKFDSMRSEDCMAIILNCFERDGVDKVLCDL